MRSLPGCAAGPTTHASTAGKLHHPTVSAFFRTHARPADTIGRHVRALFPFCTCFSTTTLFAFRPTHAWHTCVTCSIDMRPYHLSRQAGGAPWPEKGRVRLTYSLGAVDPLPDPLDGRVACDRTHSLPSTSCWHAFTYGNARRVAVSVPRTIHESLMSMRSTSSACPLTNLHADDEGCVLTAGRRRLYSGHAPPMGMVDGRRAA